MSVPAFFNVLHSRLFSKVFKLEHRSRAFKSVGTLFAFLLLVACAYGQSTFGSIRGIAADPTGASIPAASVILHSLDENNDRTTTSDSDGSYLFNSVKPGRYSITVTEAGFATTKLQDITLNARQDLRVNVQLAIASQSTIVEVTASPDQINTESATISDSKDNQLITQLPINNRATTTSPLGALGTSASVQQDSSGNIEIGGSSASEVNFSVDGVSTVNVRQNGALQDAYPSQEGIAAVKITSFNNSAEFSQVGDVTFTTKSGSNKIHGSLFEYFQNDVLDAAPYGFSGKAPKRFNTFGGSLSGPVSIPHLYNGSDKTFFFFDYEGNRRAFATLQQAVVPTAQDRMGNLSDLQTCAPNCTPGPVIPTTSINPTATALLAYYPLPNVPGVPVSSGNPNYENFQKTPARTDGADVRIDQTIGSHQSLYARFSRKNITSDVANLFLPNDSDSIHNRSLLVADTYTISQRLLNEFRYGFTFVTTGVNFPIAGATALQNLDLQGVDISQHPLTHAFPTFNFSAGTGFATIGRDKTGITQSRTTQFSDNLTYTIGKHTLKGGVDIRHLRYFDLESFAPEFNSDDFGTFVFEPTFTPNAFGDFLIGAPTTSYFAVSSPDVGGTATQYSLFAQDEWQVNSRLTLSYGLRWQVLPAFVEDGGNLANFDQSTNSIVVPDNLAGYLQQQNIVSSNQAFRRSFNDPSLPTDPTGVNQAPPAAANPGAVYHTAYITASQAGLPQGLRNTYHGNFQPRVAFAYRPFNDTKTVIRGGFGIYTLTNLGPLSFNNSGNPTSNLHVYSNSSNAAGTPVIQFPNTAPPASGNVYGGGGLDQGVDPNFRDPQSNQYSLTVERQLGANDSLRVSYVGQHTYRLSITEDLNQIPASTVPYDSSAAGTAGVYVDSRAHYQNWTTLYSTFNHGVANYHAFEIQQTHRMAKGLYYDANYTYATNRADNQGDTPNSFAGEVNYGIPITNRFNTRSDYGNEEGTRRHRFLLTGIYQLPYGDGRKFSAHNRLLNEVAGGWDINTIAVLETGPWLTPSISPSADQSNTNVEGRGAFLRPDQVSSALYKGQSRNSYFNLAAFSPTPYNAGRFGNSTVGSLQGPGTAAWSLGVAKSFRISERLHARFESTFTNVLNHTNFAAPATAIDNSTFGKLTAPQTAENAGNRTGQLALRLDF